ncbi:MAG: haloacid dehalogenase type II [Vicinamibacterales bacterium]
MTDSMSRRSVIRSAAAAVGATAVRAIGTLDAAYAQPRPGAGPEGVKALVYDVFGTCTDWRNGVARDAERILKPLGFNIDWLAFADAWRALYQPSMEEVRAGRQPWVKLDVLHRRMLDQILPKFGLQALDPRVADELNLAWHRIDTWPDVVPAFARLQKRFILAPCSNGNIALMVDVARRNHFQWDAILGSEIARDFKPKPSVYLATVAALNLQPEEVMMCAAHSADLRSAAQHGLRTAHIARPGENGPGTGESTPRVPVDVAASSMDDLARQLGV